MRSMLTSPPQTSKVSMKHRYHIFDCIYPSSVTCDALSVCTVFKSSLCIIVGRTQH